MFLVQFFVTLLIGFFALRLGGHSRTSGVGIPFVLVCLGVAFVTAFVLNYRIFGIEHTLVGDLLSAPAPEQVSPATQGFSRAPQPVPQKAQTTPSSQITPQPQPLAIPEPSGFQKFLKEVTL